MNEVIIHRDGPDVSDCSVEHEFNVSDDVEIQIAKNDKNQYFAVFEWESIGPFPNKEKTLEGICIKLFNDLEKSNALLYRIANLAIGSPNED